MWSTSYDFCVFNFLHRYQSNLFVTGAELSEFYTVWLVNLINQHYQQIILRTHVFDVSHFDLNLRYYKANTMANCWRGVGPASSSIELSVGNDLCLLGRQTYAKSNILLYFLRRRADLTGMTFLFSLKT